MRRYLEQITGVVTGADMNVEETLPEILWGLLGQQTVSDSNLVWVTKTHYPLNVFQNEEVFNAQKMIVIVRNPIDIIPSVAGLDISKSHSFEFKNKLNEEFPNWWDGWMTAFCENIKTSQEFVIRNIAT